MKRKFVKVMFFGALALSTVTYVGCKDYDDDIDNLQTQIDAVKVSLEELQTKVNSGSVITNVVKGENGITVTLSDGKSYELTNGKNGADADVWTIGEKDGYWYKNGVKTEYKAVGVDGAPVLPDRLVEKVHPVKTVSTMYLTKQLAVLIFIRMVNW